MKRLIIMALALVVSTGAIAQNVVIRNGNVIDVESGKLLKGYDVVVKNGVIAKVKKGSKKRIKKGEIDATGKYISPGLIDSHVHWGDGIVSTDKVDIYTKNYLNAGVTTVREMGSNVDNLIEYNRKLKAGTLIGPYVYYPTFWAGADYFKMAPSMPTDVYWSYAVDKDTDFEKLIDEAMAKGCTGVKLYRNIDSMTMYKAVALCKKKGLKVWSHFSVMPTKAIDVVKSGVEVVSHSYLLENEASFNDRNYHKIRFSPEEKAKRAEVFKEMAKRGTILDATESMQINGTMSFSHEYAKEALEHGVTIVAGTDTFDWANHTCPFSKEIEFYQEGLKMSPIEIIRSATTTGAKILGMEGKLGVIKKGAEADIVIVNENPLEDIRAYRNIESVYVNGVKYE